MSNRAEREERIRDLQTQQRALEKKLAKRIETLKEMQAGNIKFQRQQGTKDDIYRIRRDLADVMNELDSFRRFI